MNETLSKNIHLMFFYIHAHTWHIHTDIPRVHCHIGYNKKDEHKNCCLNKI